MRSMIRDRLGHVIFFAWMSFSFIFLALIFGPDAAHKFFEKPPPLDLRIKMMPLGDSITAFSCWRAYLWQSLAAENVTENLNWVGTLYDSTNTCPVLDEAWNHHHEGHAGYTTYNIATRKEFLKAWLLETGGPDIVFFHLGTNDIMADLSTQSIIDSFGLVVDELRSANKAVKIIAAQILPIVETLTKVMGDGNEAVVNLNAEIPGWVESKTTDESPITTVNCYEGFDGDDLMDTVHPNDSGARKFRDCVFPEVLRVIRDVENERAAS